MSADRGWAFLQPTDVMLATEAVKRYQNSAAHFVLFENGTALFLKPQMDKDEIIAGAMDELKMKRDFEVSPMKDGNFTVWLAPSVCVFISAQEAKDILLVIRAREAERLASKQQENPMPEDAIIGLAGREKAHKDAQHKNLVFRSHERT